MGKGREEKGIKPRKRKEEEREGGHVQKYLDEVQRNREESKGGKRMKQPKWTTRHRGIMKGMRTNAKRKHLQGQWGAVGARVVFAVSDERGGDGGNGL